MYIPPISNRAKNHNGQLLFSKVLTGTVAKGCVVRYRGLRFYFSCDTERIYSQALLAGKLKFVAYADRAELHLLNGDGQVKVLGSVRIEPGRVLQLNGRPLADKSGPIAFAAGKAKRYVKAEVLFSEFGKIRRNNYFNPLNARASVFYGNLEFLLPVDEDNRHGTAAREKRIFAIANPRRIEFHEERREGGSIYIGAIDIDPEGYLLKDGVRYGEFNINRKRAEMQPVPVADLIENFALRDIQVKFNEREGRAKVGYRGVNFLFSNDIRNIHYRDIFDGYLFLRVGYRDRMDVIRKKQGVVKVIGSISVKDGKYLELGRGRYLRLDAPFDDPEYCVIGRVIPELRAKDIPVLRRKNIYYVEINRIRFKFPSGEGIFYKPQLEEGKMFCRVYGDRFQVGIKEDAHSFRELGKVEFSRAGFLMSRGERVRYQGKPVIKRDPRQPGIRIDRLIPDLGRIEKAVPESRRIMQWGIRFFFDLDPRDEYYHYLPAGKIFFRAVGRRGEVFIDKGENGREFIGSFSLDEKGYLLNESCDRHKTVRGPVRSGEKEDVRVSHLIKAFKPGSEDLAEIIRLLIKSEYNTLYEIFSGGNGRQWIKILALFGHDYLNKPTADELIAVKVLFSLASGLERLIKENNLSEDLKEAFSHEVISVMARALDNPALSRVRDSLRIHYAEALAAAGLLQPIDLTTEAQR